MLHPVTWVVWTVVGAVTATMTHNPLYLAILAGVVAIQYTLASRRHPEAQGWRTLLRLAFGLAALTIPLNALNAHAGSHVLFRLPARWPLIGGNITLEAVLWGATTALGLMVLMALFATLNLEVDQAQILRLTPAFLYEAGLIASIALTFIPQMLSSAREIREAQLIRGHRIRRARDVLPLVMALLTTGLERSFQLAESMEARGFGNVRPVARLRDVLLKSLTLLGLAGVLGSVFALTYLSSGRWAAQAGLALSVALLLATFWAQGRRVQRTRYRRERWTWRDGAVAGAGMALLGTLVAVRLTHAAALQYYPYTQLLPPFQPWLGGALLLLAVPAMLQSAGERTTEYPSGHCSNARTLTGMRCDPRGGDRPRPTDANIGL
jgi:energy-coupling factor transport system permease protein